MNGDIARFTKHFYEFGPFRLDATDRQLLREGVPLSLTPKALDTLLVLVRNCGRTLEKDELMKAVWHDTIVEENNLTQNVSALRKVLGQDFRFIQTVPRRGYRFIAEVSERWEEIPTLIVRQHTRSSVIIEEEQDSEPEDQVVSNSTGASSRGTLGQRLLRLSKKPAVLTAGATVLLVSAIMGVSLLSVRRRVFRASPERTDLPRTIPPLARGDPDGQGAIPPLARGKYLAVLPFRTEGDSGWLNYVGEGVREAISDKLFQLGDIRVVSVPSVPEMSRRKTAAVLVKDLGVNLAVVGSVQEAGDKLRIVVSLEEVAADRQVWTREFAGSRKHLLGLEDQILASLVTALWLPHNGRDLAQLSVHPTENDAAYDLYLRGREAVRNFNDVKDIEGALQLYEQALSMDPGFALAYAGLADASLEMYEQNDEKLLADKAIHAAREALRQAPTTAEAHFALGSAMCATGHFDEAVAELQHGLQRAPNSDEGYRRLGSVYLAQGRTEEARRAYEKAIRLSPFYPDDYQTLGEAYL
ncbi:MAG TPA: tetratricopeptide repeat protein, partial [Terriglobia bacterium]|nr:tetratricopeptide repeat protein [Terriglobia bacterium]